MKMFKTALFLLCSVAILVSGTEDVKSKQMIKTEDSPSIVDPVANRSTSTSTASNQTTTQPITTPVTVATTSAPSNTTTSTPAPTPDPDPNPGTGKWIANGTTEICIIAQMAVQFNVKYVTAENKTEHKVLNLPADKTSADGVCGTPVDTEQNITLTWNSTNPASGPHNLTLRFVQNITASQYALHRLEVSFAAKAFSQNEPNSSITYAHTSDQFRTKLNNSYRCLKNQVLTLTTLNNETECNITVSNLQFQAFHRENTSNFGLAEDCAFDTPDIVPIIVGCALAILVVIVLIAYLVGRRRSQARGYLSM